MNSLFLLILLYFPQNTYMGEVDAAVQRGEVTRERGIELLEWAARGSAQLPLKWQAVLEKYPLAMKSHTPLLIEAYQRRMKAGLTVTAPSPGVMTYYLDSAIYPLRVYYDEEGLLEKAQETLRTAEISWQKEIDEWGFYQPALDPVLGRYLVYLGYAGGAAGYTSPTGSIEETPWDDCSTYIVIESGLELWSIGDTMSHELNHATQGAMDCLEPVTFWENTAVFVEMAAFPESASNNRWFSYYFQIDPQLSISEGQSPYWYGGYVWPTFLAHTYGEGPEDVPFVREIWELSMQESGDNSPHYMGAIAEKLSQYGATLNDAFHQFSVARFFVDSRYVSGLSSMPYGDRIFPVPPIVQTIEIDYPQALEPGEASRPKPYGVNYYVLRQPDGYSRITRISLRSDEMESLWALQVVSLSTQKSLHTAEGVGHGFSVEYDPGETGDVLLVVEHLGGEDFSPARVPARGTAYTLLVEPAVPLPTLTLASPNAVRQGETVTFTIYGAGLQEGATLSFIPAKNMELNSVVVESSSKIVATVTVPKDALTGMMGITVTNPDEGAFTLDDGIEIIEKLEDGGQGGCTTGRHAPVRLPAIFLLFLVGVALIRTRFAK